MMIFAITAMVLVTFAVLAWINRPRIAGRRVLFRTEPDRPQPFGDAMTWIAVGTTRTEAVLSALGVKRARPSNWASGVATVYDPEFASDRVFIAPPVNGWTLIAGTTLPRVTDLGSDDRAAQILRALSQTFGSCQLFSAEVVPGGFAWAQAEGGSIVRAEVVEHGRSSLTYGRRERDEDALRKDLFELDGMYDRRGDFGSGLVFLPTSAFVFALAGHWSVDPTRLGSRAVASVPKPGWIVRWSGGAAKAVTSRRAAA
ncbi:MAG: hypothetical protein AAFQ45_11785 [Pseudomonadota bacterium]